MKTYILTFMLGLLGFGELMAQQRRSVLLNTNPEPLKFTFQSNFPFPVTLANKGVKLHQWYNNTLDTNQIQAFNVKKNEVNIGQSRIERRTTFAETSLNIKEWKQEALNLKGVLDSDNKAITFYGSNPSSNPYSINKQPKLVIDYEVTKEPYGTAWSQLDGNAQHNNCIDWNRDGSFNALKSTALLNGQNIQFVTSYQNKIVVFGNNYMAMLDGNKEAWRLNLKEIPVTQPVISPEGRMFFVTGSSLVAVDLNDPSRTPIEKKLSEINIGRTITINSLKNEMSIGYDGTLYMPIANATGTVGVVALAAYPNFQPRWFYNTTNPIGPVSLSQNERMAFFIETDKKTTKSRVVVLDNVSGEVLTQSESILGAYANDGNSYIPPVVIQTAKNDTTVVYALDGNKTANKLYVFKVHHNQLLDKPNATLQPHHLITSTDGISQPTVKDNSTVLFIEGKSVGAYSHQNNKKDYAKAKSTISKDADFIETDSKIVGNKSAKDYYIISKRKMFLVNTYHLSGVRAEFDGFTKDVNKDIKSVITLPDYSLCLLYNDGDVVSFYPSNYDRWGSPTIDKIENKTVYINNSMAVTTDLQKENRNNTTVSSSVVPENIQAIIIAPQIRVKSGFNVQKGAALTFQIIK